MAKRNSPLRRWKRLFKKMAKKGYNFDEARKKADELTGYDIGAQVNHANEIMRLIDSVAEKVKEKSTVEEGTE